MPWATDTWRLHERRPSPTGVHTECGTPTPGGEAKQLLQEGNPLSIDATSRLKHQSTEIKPRSNEAGVIFPVFIRPGIDVGGTVGPHVRGREWTSDGHVHSQTLSVGPERDRDVPRSPTGSRT